MAKSKTKAKTVTKTVSSYDPWISIKKLIYQAIIVAIIAFLTYWVDTGFAELTLEFPEYAAIIAIASAAVVAILNYLKHYRDTALVKVNEETGEIVEVLK